MFPINLFDFIIKVEDLKSYAFARGFIKHFEENGPSVWLINRMKSRGMTDGEVSESINAIVEKMRKAVQKYERENISKSET